MASSTNLGGWINKMGVYSSQARINYFKEAQIPQLLNWEQSPNGQHVELGISENDFFLLLTALGLSSEFFGETLLPIGTIYDTFISRGLDALNYGLYCKSKFIFVGSPSGISLSREGGAHQSVITPSIGAELPHLVYYEPCFGQELEWILLASLRNLLDREHGTSVYLRLPTVPIDQGLFPLEPGSAKESELRRGVLRGAYRLVDRGTHSDYRPGENVANVFACGVMVPIALEASRELERRATVLTVPFFTSLAAPAQQTDTELLRAIHCELKELRSAILQAQVVAPLVEASVRERAQVEARISEIEDKRGDMDQLVRESIARQTQIRKRLLELSRLSRDDSSQEAVEQRKEKNSLRSTWRGPLNRCRSTNPSKPGSLQTYRAN